MSEQGDEKRLSELTVGDAKRILVYALTTLLAVALLILLVEKVLVALLLGVVAGAYLLPVQEWLEQRLRARAGSAIITILLIVVPLVLIVGYAWYELSGYSNLVHEQRNQIILAISRALAQYVSIENTRSALEVTFTEAVTRSGAAIQELRQRAALLLASSAIFFFTVFYVLTQRVRLAAYIKVRVPGEYLPLYEKLTANIGGALRGALLAVFIDQTLKGFAIVLLNLVFGVPLALVLGIVTVLVGFFPLLGEWAVYVPVSVYLLVFRNEPTSAGIYLGVGILMTLGSSLLLRPRLAASGARRFNFYWMLVALVSGVYTFGIPGIVLGPAILGFTKAVAETLVGDVRYETSLLKEEKEQADETAQHSNAAD
ncbi:MAG TPA: AI-2E family transporter [Pyrinomonadaceae bacterium]|jgi:predicted PurR-regulated permease PerM|nr:AI-2E family transporter [Pyrinomonadaceae bacterium]